VPPLKHIAHYSTAPGLQLWENLLDMCSPGGPVALAHWFTRIKNADSDGEYWVMSRMRLLSPLTLLALVFVATAQEKMPLQYKEKGADR
jgi:hypothetical protein